MVGARLIKTVLKVLAGLIGAIVIGVGVLVIVARSSDGPLGIVAGGAFSSGELHQGPEPRWDTLVDVDTVEFQSLDPARSRTTWIAVHDARIFIPSGYMTTWWGRLWKQWPIEAERDGRVILRADGKLYERELVRVMAGPELPPVLAELGRKYGGGRAFPMDAVTNGYLWIFELVPRRAATRP
ncbi:MAG: hypothetical protein GWM88_17575 [Pseudomonadales bacterium]|nr:hypothetical protein [Pseudomonadales bacterium]NIX09743.1 hypothetical protein [Pseudomonadales bacterium]